jgi:hypothetical protein
VDVTVGASRRIAVLSKKELLTHPYHRWLSGDDVVLFAEDTAATRSELNAVGDRYDAVKLFEGWKSNRAVDLMVMREHDKRPFDRIVALSEGDQVRAGQLRERLGIPGQDTTSAAAFRNKAMMKYYAVRAGLDVPAYSTVAHVGDVVDFAASVSGPVVVKPVDGAGSKDVVVIGNAKELRAWAAQQAGPRDEPPRLIVEEYIDAPMLTVDGIMRHGSIVGAVVSAYEGTCLESLSGLRPLGLLQLDDESSTARQTLSYARKVVAALPGPDEPTSFHLEVFDHPLRGPLLCEIACRTGGVRINDAVHSTLGIDLEETCTRGQAGRDMTSLPRKSTQRVGTVVVPSPGARLSRAPDSCEVRGVFDFRMHLAEGEEATRASKTADVVADMLLRGRDHAELASIYTEAVRWLEGALEWAPALTSRSIRVRAQPEMLGRQTREAACPEGSGADAIRDPSANSI